MAAGLDVIGRYRWRIGLLLFASTVINYLDRQTLSVLAPQLKTEYAWSNETFAWVIISFRLAYTVMQPVSGRLLDRFGTRNGLTLAVLWYSTAAMLTAFATGLKSFCALRFLLGVGEAANWPGATKAVAEWFPRRERGWAVALFDSGSSFGAAVAVGVVPLMLVHFGGWRPAFLVTGALGFAWVLFWRRSYHPPEAFIISAGSLGPPPNPSAMALALPPEPPSLAPSRSARRRSLPRVSAGELQMILADRAEEGVGEAAAQAPPPATSTLLRLPQTWGAIAARGLTDPVWFMITDWFAIYLVSRGFRLEETALGFWVPFLAADLGNFFGGGASSALIRRGWTVGEARRALIVAGGFGVLALIPAALSSSFAMLVACFALATFSYAAMSTMALSLPADLFESRAVASVAGMAGAAAGAGTLVSTYLIGLVADRFSFTPILITASVVPLAAAAFVITLVRNGPESGRGLLKTI